MKRILEELERGNIDPQSRTYRKDSNYAKGLSKLCKLEEELLSKLGEEEKVIFKKFMSMQGELESHLGMDKFLTGYRLGARMMIEVFYHSENDSVCHRDSDI